MWVPSINIPKLRDWLSGLCPLTNNVPLFSLPNLCSEVSVQWYVRFLRDKVVNFFLEDVHSQYFPSCCQPEIRIRSTLGVLFYRWGKWGLLRLNGLAHWPNSCQNLVTILWASAFQPRFCNTLGCLTFPEVFHEIRTQLKTNIGQIITSRHDWTNKTHMYNPFQHWKHEYCHYLLRYCISSGY